MLYFYLMKWKLCKIVEYIKQYMNIHTILLFSFCLHIFKGNNWCVSLVDTNFHVCFFTDTVQERFFKLCAIITLLGVYQFMPDLMILTLFQGHRCVRIINCKMCFNVLVYRSLNVVWFWHTIKRSGKVCFEWL